MPTKGTKVIAVRVKEEIIEELTRRAIKRGMTVNAWVNWAIEQGIRSHKKRGGK